MMKKLAVLVSVLALAAFGIAACGGDDDDDEGTTEAAPATTTTEAGGGGGGGGGGTVQVSADPSGQLAFEQSSLEAPSGSDTFEFTNDSSVGHDFVIEDADGNQVGGTDVITGDSTTLEVDLQPGEYTFFCSVDAHREAGMEGPLTVK
jgi:plastocyanin